MKKQTAVEWLVEQIFKKSDIQYINGFDGLIEQAIAMEKEQIEEYAKFCIHCDRNKLPLLDFEGFLNL